MNGVGGDTIAATLIGCSFQTQKSEEAEDDGFPILAVDISSSKVTVRSSNGSASSVPLGRGHVEMTDAANSLVNQVRDRLAAPYPDDVKVLRENEIDVEMTQSDAVIVARALSDSGVPNERQRFDVLNILKRYDLRDHVYSLTRKWALRSQPIPPDVAIQLVKCQRYDGDIEAALHTLAVSLDDDSVTQKQRSVLLTQNAAVLLDLYERSANYSDLRGARKAYATAFEIDPASKHLARVAARLKSLE